MSAFRM